MRKKQKGSVLVLTLVLMVMLLFLTGVLLQLILLNYMHITKSAESEKAFWIAKAGLSEAKYYVVKNWFDPDLDPNQNNGYTGIIDICKKMVRGKNFGTNSDGTVSGSYKVGISPINGPGVHEIVIASEGITVPIEDYKRLDEYAADVRKDGFRVSLILRLRMDSPTDYLFFWNGDSGMRLSYTTWINGPVYANGSFYICTNLDTPSTGGYVVNHQYFFKSETLKGPSIHCNGTFWTPTGFDGDVRVGEGRVKWGPADWTGIATDQHYFTHNTESNALTPAFHYDDAIITNPPGYSPVFDYYQPVPTHETPNITFDVEQLDGKTRHLLQDKFHGAYNIYCPTKDEIYKVFQRYIDQNFYIKNAKSTSIPGAKISSFYNTLAKQKTPFPFVDRGKEVIGFMKYGRPSGELGTMPMVLNPMQSYAYTKFNPFSWATAKGLQVGGMAVNNDNYSVVSGDGGWYTNPNIVFAAGFNMGAGTPVMANKCRFLYGTNDGVNFLPDATISPVNWDIQGGTVSMRNSISNEPPIDAQWGYGKLYQTASFMNPSSISATVINIYDYSPKTGDQYGYHRRHTLTKLNGNDFGTGWREDLTQGTATVTGPKDDAGTDLSVEWGAKYTKPGGDDRRWSTWESSVPPAGYIQYEPHSGLIKAGGGPGDANAGAVIKLRPMIRNSNSTGIASDPSWNHTVHGGAVSPVYWFGVPEMGCVTDPVPYAGGGNHYAPNATAGAYINLFKTAPSGSTNAGKKALMTTSGALIAFWSGTNWQNPDGSVFSDFGGTGIGIPYTGVGGAFTWEIVYRLNGGGNSEMDGGEIQFINNDPQSIGATDVCISYLSRRKEIISVSGLINNPYKYTCTDQWVDFVSLDLSKLDEDNWPKYGLIFADVPLFVSGIPKKKITIVSTKDVYLGSINYSYWNSSGIWVPSPYTMGDERANPVAVISGGQIYVDFQENTDRSLHPISELTELHSTDAVFAVRNLNKVIFYSQTDNLYYSEGTASNRTFMYGSAVLGRKTGLIAGKNDAFHTNNVIDWDITRMPISRFDNEGMGGFAGILGSGSQRVYEESFRYNLPPCIPKTIKAMDYTEGHVDKIESMLKQLDELLATLDETSPQVKKKGLAMIDDSQWEIIGNTILTD